MHHHSLRAAISFTVLAVATSSVAFAAPIVRATAGHAGPSGVAGQAARPEGKKQQQLLYVGDNSGNKIYVYKLKGKKSSQPIATITQGPYGPQGLTTDEQGSLYATNLYGNNVTIYKAGSLVPSVTLTNSVLAPTDVKVDGFGNIYVANSPGFGAASYILRFPAGSTAPNAIWYTPQINQVISGITLLNSTMQGQVSVYAAGYTLNGSGFATGSVLSCFPGTYTCNTITSSYGQTAGIAVAQSPGNQPFQYLVVDQYVPGVDTLTNQQPGGQLVTGGTPEFVALNSTKSRLFVADRFYGRVTEYAWPSGTVVTEFTPGHDATVYGVAVSPAGTYF